MSKNIQLVLIGIIILVYCFYLIGKEDEKRVPQSGAESISLCEKWGGEVIYRNGKYADCALNGQLGRD